MAEPSVETAKGTYCVVAVITETENYEGNEGIKAAFSVKSAFGIQDVFCIAKGLLGAIWANIVAVLSVLYWIGKI